MGCFCEIVYRFYKIPAVGIVVASWSLVLPAVYSSEIFEKKIVISKFFRWEGIKRTLQAVFPN
jgi:hypothetical protein